MHMTPIPAGEVWPEADTVVLLPPDGDPTGDVRPLEVAVDTVLCSGRESGRFNVRIELDAGDLEALKDNPVLWVSTLGEHFHPMAVGLLPQGVDHARPS